MPLTPAPPWVLQCPVAAITRPQPAVVAVSPAAEGGRQPAVASAPGNRGAPPARTGGL